MARCAKCGKEVGCGCNLLNGNCHVCFNEGLSTVPQEDASLRQRSTKRIVYSQPGDTPPNTEFEKILNTNGLTKEEKIKRINDILEKARQDAANQS